MESLQYLILHIFRIDLYYEFGFNSDFFFVELTYCVRILLRSELLWEWNLLIWQVYQIQNYSSSTHDSFYLFGHHGSSTKFVIKRKDWSRSHATFQNQVWLLSQHSTRRWVSWKARAFKAVDVFCAICTSLSVSFCSYQSSQNPFPFFLSIQGHHLVSYSRLNVLYCSSLDWSDSASWHCYRVTNFELTHTSLREAVYYCMFFTYPRLPNIFFFRKTKSKQ